MLIFYGVTQWERFCFKFYVIFTGDPEVAPVFVKTLLPVFAQVYSGTLVYSVR